MHEVLVSLNAYRLGFVGSGFKTWFRGQLS